MLATSNKSVPVAWPLTHFHHNFHRLRQTAAVGLVSSCASCASWPLPGSPRGSASSVRGSRGGGFGGDSRLWCHGFSMAGNISPLPGLVNGYITNWKDPAFLMGKATISTGPWLPVCFLYVYQRISLMVHFSSNQPIAFRTHVCLHSSWLDPKNGARDVSLKPWDFSHNVGPPRYLSWFITPMSLWFMVLITI